MAEPTTIIHQRLDQDADAIIDAVAAADSRQPSQIRRMILEQFAALAGGVDYPESAVLAAAVRKYQEAQ